MAPVLADQDPGVAFLTLVSAPWCRPASRRASPSTPICGRRACPGVFRAIPRAVGMEMPGGGSSTRTSTSRRTSRVSTSRRSSPSGRRTLDACRAGALRILADAAANGNHDVTVRYYVGANHGIKIDEVLVPEFARDVSAWVQGLPGRRAPADRRRRAAEPALPRLGRAEPRWYGNGDIVIGLVIVGGALLVVGPAVWLVTGACVGSAARPVPRAAGPGLRWPLVGLAVGSVATMVGLVVYLVSVARLALDYKTDTWVVQGGWIAVRVLGLATVVAAALIINRLTDIRSARKAVALAPEGGGVVVRPATGLGARTTLWATVAGSTILLVTLAYWGVYQLGI
ncbi:hypothetical protein NKG05_25115 [Oerskovia sp. M15]